MALEDRLKEIRGHLSRQEFGDIFGVNRDTIMRYENGKNPPSAIFIKNLCSKYHVNADWLLLGHGPKYWNEKRWTILTEEGFDELLVDIQEWLTVLEEEEEDDDPRAWFRVQFKKQFPDFKEWLKKRNKAKTETNNRRVA